MPIRGPDCLPFDSDRYRPQSGGLGGSGGAGAISVRDDLLLDISEILQKAPYILQLRNKSRFEAALVLAGPRVRIHFPPAATRLAGPRVGAFWKAR
jgi:hypothetical protein